MKNRDKKIMNMITENTLPVDFVDFLKNIGPPASKFVINGITVCERTDEFCTVLNGCYHMKHKDEISKRVQASQSHSSPAIVSP
mmetsp:Transcript_40515/g.45188  ORF Transcript_40515/g.45188 Transcript_40515/m.45188 type:complete len:84 (+) Transcript_40515:485-736(+)